LVVVWRITETCDLACPFCAYSRHLKNRPRVAASPDDVLRFGALLGEYARQTRRNVLVSWLGGEPLLWPPLFEISRFFRHNFGLRLGVTTNGTRLTSAEVRERLTEDFDHLILSVDGLSAFHDCLRNANGLFAQLQHNLAQLRERKAQRGHGPRLRVNTILMRDNICAFEDLGCALAEWGIEELTFNALGGRDRPEFFPDHSLRPEDVEWLRESLPGIQARLAEKGLKILGSEHYLNRLAASANNCQLPITDCSPGQTFIFINERGLISPCSFTTSDYGLSLNEIHTLDDLRHLPQRFAGRKRQRMAEPCYDCQSTQVFGKFERVSP